MVLNYQVAQYKTLPARILENRHSFDIKVCWLCSIKSLRDPIHEARRPGLGFRFGARELLDTAPPPARRITLPSSPPTAPLLRAAAAAAAWAAGSLRTSGCAAP